MKTSDIPVLLPWKKRAISVCRVPGGQSNYLHNLSKICSWVKKGSLSFDKLVTRVETEFELRVGSGDASRFLKFLLSAGLIEQEDSVILQLPEQTLMIRTLHTPTACN